MSNKLGKNLHHCFSTFIKCSSHQHQHHHQIIPNTPSSHHSSTSTSTFTKNYNSLFQDDEPVYFSVSATASNSGSDNDEAPDLTAAYASRRFFISSPGRSNSIVDSLSSSSSLEVNNRRYPGRVVSGVAVETYSPDPYIDFRESMEEMMEAREEGGDAWDYLQELLLNYLRLNPKKTHKFIVRAFADLVATTMSPIINININNNNGGNSNSNGESTSLLAPNFSSYCAHNIVEWLKMRYL